MTRRMFFKTCAVIGVLSLVPNIVLAKPAKALDTPVLREGDTLSVKDGGEIRITNSTIYDIREIRAEDGGAIYFCSNEVHFNQN